MSDSGHSFEKTVRELGALNALSAYVQVDLRPLIECIEERAVLRVKLAVAIDALKPLCPCDRSRGEFVLHAPPCPIEAVLRAGQL